VPAGTPYADLFESAGAAHGIAPRLLAAVAKVESGFNPSAVSSAGARGLMQFMPATAAGMNVNPMDPASAVDGAARLLRGHLERFGSMDLALAAYNAGGGAVSRAGGIPPYPETQAYVRKVLALAGGASS
jgi:soluble lytic murein transglycosylase-like protein